jgi:hypothetical protein
MPHDPHLADLMRAALAKRRGVVEMKMFGGPCWMLDGNMLCGAEVGRFMFRVGKGQEAEALSRPGASPMDITGKPMRGIIWVDADAAIDASLEEWIDFASRFVGALAPK